MNKEEIKKRIVELEAERNNLQAELDILNKITPEERFAELIQGLEVRTNLAEYPDSVFFFKKKERWMEYNEKNQTFYLNCDKIWSVFENEFRFNYNDIKEFTSRMVEKHFKYRGVTTLGPI